MRVRLGRQRAEHRGADAQGDGVAHQRHTHRTGRRRPVGHGRVRAVRVPHVPEAGRLPPGRPVLLQLVAVRVAPFGLLASVPHHIHLADGHPGRVEVSNHHRTSGTPAHAVSVYEYAGTARAKLDNLIMTGRIIKKLLIIIKGWLFRCGNSFSSF